MNKNISLIIIYHQRDLRSLAMISSLLEVLFEVLWHGFFYFFTPRILFNHLVAAGLLFSLHQQRVELKRIIQLAVVQECVIYALSTLTLLDGFGSVISAYFCLVTYEHAIGVRLEVHENVSFVSGEFTQYFEVYSVF